MERALYGSDGFYLRERPSRHFRTSVSASPVFAEAVARILADLDARLGRPPRLDLVDVGAGEGTLAARTLSLVRGDPAHAELAARLRVTGVELAARPLALPAEIGWRDSCPEGVVGLVICNEWLDNVPLDVVEGTPDGPRTVLVDPATGEERLGPAPCPDDLAWLARWWPLRPGRRAEIGRTRDEAWASVLGRIERGRAIAIDYAHPVDDRPPCGTLCGYREGSVVAPVPDGSCDITAHVALDSCATATPTATATATRLTTQREALRALGFDGRPPGIDLARTSPREYLRALARASEEAELIDPNGLGGFGWLCQDIG
ncbi:SAM-dependent methyltransferase [Spongiactinospora sp. TRM90649]|uniref:SAM-dependent methyltransferase n=1 Tax=Spongiactinospora sp. TRM90649 TaxID=3031114 RepID=UPI0023F76224|nr:SAM-dependent methyltransferase [Spongiactinospora sp. TRM90649]MDF5758924.1 SAM-dependent methyltransferase [Spongiactinospora sp. TRM90649]